MYWLRITTVGFLMLHVVGSLWKFSNPAGEQVRQHHEKCTMMGLVALAIEFLH
jgi:hypothetical protein